MAWRLCLFFTLFFSWCSAGAVVSLLSSSDESQPLHSHSPTSEADEIQQTALPFISTDFTEERDSRFSQDLLVPVLSNSVRGDGSGDGSGLSIEEIHGTAPSLGILERNGFVLNATETKESGEFLSRHPLSLPGRVTHQQEGAIRPDVNGLQNSQNVATAYDSIRNNQSLTAASEAHQRKEIAVDSTLNTTESQKTFSSDSLDYVAMSNTEENISKALKTVQKTSGDNWHRQNESSFSSLEVTVSTVMTTEEVQELTEAVSVQTEPPHAGDEPVHLTDVQIHLLSSRNNPKEETMEEGSDKWLHFGSVFGPVMEKSLPGPEEPCALGLSPCATSTNPNGTLILWDDLSRTLAFAWELHVFGSAALFLLLVVGAVWGVISGSNLLHPLCEALTLTNILLLLAGLLRAAHFFVDPYGTRHILKRPALTALCNLPIALLLWTQSVLALFTLPGERLNLLPTILQRPPIAGGLAAMHCTSLFVADLLSQSLSPALPLMLQTLSVCWGLPLCLGILFQTLTPQSSSIRTAIPCRGASRWVEKRAKSVLAVCAFLGVVCCGFQIHTMLWLYGLLGDWRRFSWGWWLSQFWARLLELAWGFSLLLLGSAMFWMPNGSTRRGGQNQSGPEGIKKGKLTSCWDRLLLNVPMGPWQQSGRNLAELMPNNWAAHQRSRTNIVSSVTDSSKDISSSKGCNFKDTNIGSRTANNSNNHDSHAVPMSTYALEWGERECILSLIEIDLCPPPPINFNRNINCALHKGDALGVGSVFIPPPLSWSQSGGTAEVPGGDPGTPTHLAYRWALDTESSTVPPHLFGTLVQQTESLETVSWAQQLSPQNQEIEGVRPVWERNSAIPKVNQDDDWSSVASGDDVTNF